MKKLLAMLLVLGLASLANATPIMSFDLVPTPGSSGHGFSPDDPLLPSEWVELDVVYNSNNALYSSGMLYISIEGNGEWCGDDADTFLPPGVPIEDAWTVHPNFTANAAIPGGNSMTKVDAQHIEIGGATAPYTFVQVNPGETIFDHLNIHCTGEGEIIVTLRPATSTANPIGTPQYWEADGSATVEDLEALGSSITIYQVPEPMTMALLGIGGLALIRRRRS
jgi:hypothetical protein